MEDNQESGQEYVEEEQAPSYELSLTGPGMTIKRTVGQDVALGVITLLMEGAPAAATTRSVPLSPGRPPVGLTVSRTASPESHTVGEFLSEVEAKRNPRQDRRLRRLPGGRHGQEAVHSGRHQVSVWACRRAHARELRSRLRLGDCQQVDRRSRWLQERVLRHQHRPQGSEAKFSDEFIKKTKRPDRSRRRPKAKGTAKDQEAGSEAE